MLTSTPPKSLSRLPLSHAERRSLWIAGGLVALATVAVLVSAFFGDRLANAIVDSGLAARLANTFRGRDLSSPETWQRFFQSGIKRFVLGTVGLAVLVACFGFRHRDWWLTRYFREQDSPLQLAMVRIVCCLVSLLVLWNCSPLQFCNLDPNLTIAPFPWYRLLRGVSFPLGLSTVVVAVCYLANICCAIGLFTRSSAAVAAISGLYAFGISQSFGKVNHYHMVVWFPAILAFSRAGDFLSVDALWRARRLARRGEMVDLSPSNAYALPTRLIWLLLAQVYFFPGYYKFVGGTDSHLLEWAFSDSLQNKLAVQWYIQEMPPTLRLDAYPLVCRLLSLLVIVWECVWPLALFSRRLRLPLALSTIFFHYSTSLVMGIVFIHMRWLMLTLFPWPAIFAWLGRGFIRVPAVVEYSPASPRQLYLVNVFKSFDLWQLLEFRPAPSSETAAPQPEQLVVCLAGEVLDPIAASWAIRRRLGWPMSFRWLAAASRKLPANHFLKNAMADSQAPPSPPPKSQPGVSQATLTRWLIGVATTFLLLNSLMAVAHMHRAWPFAVFPTFETLTLHARVHELQIELIDHAGRMTLFERAQATKAVQGVIWYEMSSQALLEPSPAAQQNQLRGIWDLFKQKGLVDESNVAEVRFYDVTIDTVPERMQTPLERKLIFEMPVGSLSARQ